MNSAVVGTCASISEKILHDSQTFHSSGKIKFSIYHLLSEATTEHANLIRKHIW